MRMHSFIKLTVLGLLLVGADSGTRALAQDADALRPLRVDDYFALKDASSPRVSPDGAWVAFTVRSQDLETDQRETRLWMVPISGAVQAPRESRARPTIIRFI